MSYFNHGARLGQRFVTLPGVWAHSAPSPRPQEGPCPGGGCHLPGLRERAVPGPPPTRRVHQAGLLRTSLLPLAPGLQGRV